MALYTTPDGRVIVGSGIDNGNDYHGFNGKRDIVIQLTADGATTDGLNALEYLKSYAENAKEENKPIFPNGTRVFISANGYTKAVEADDVVIDGDNITIGGIVWNGSAWDYTNAGQSGGGSGGGVLVVNGTWDDERTTCTLDKTWQEIYDGGFGVVKIVDEGSIDYFPITVVAQGLGLYFVGVWNGNDMARLNFSATSASGYPIHTESGD